MTDQQKVQLLPCPFCGGEAKASRKDGDERVGYNHTITIACDSCGSSLSKGSSHDKGGWCNESAESTELRAVEAWNTRQAALAHASSATGKENLTVGEGEAVAWRSKNYDPIFNGGYAWAFTCDPGSVTPMHEPLYTHPAPSAEDARDAERYRWLRGTDLNREFEVCREAKDGSMYVLEGSLLDESIDQALAAERGEGNGH